MTFTTSNDYRLHAQNDMYLNAQAGDVNITANSSNLAIVLENASSNLTIFSSCNIGVTASNTYGLSASVDVNMSAVGGDFNMWANDSNMYVKMMAASSNLSLYSSSNITGLSLSDMTFTTSNDYRLHAENDMFLNAQAGDVNITANSSNLAIVLENASSNLTIFSSCNIGVTASNTFGLSASVDVNMSAVGGDFNMWANDSNMYVKMMAASSNLSVYSSSNITGLSMSDMTFTTSNDYRLHAQNDMYLNAQAGDVNITANSSNLAIVLENASSNLTIFSSCNIGVTASNTFGLSASTDVNVSAVNGDVNIWANQSNMYVKMDASASNLAIFSSSNATFLTTKDMYLTASNSLAIDANKDAHVIAQNGRLDFMANNSNVVMNLDGYTGDYTFYTSRDVSSLVGRSVTETVTESTYYTNQSGEYLQYAESNIFLTSHQSNMYIRMKMPEDTIDIYGLSNISITTSNSLSLAATSNLNVDANNLFATFQTDASIGACNSISMTACNDVTIRAQDTLTLNANSMAFETRSDLGFSAPSNINFYIQSSSNMPQDPIFIISNDQVKVRGDLLITGTINTTDIITTAVVQENLKVSDKVIILSSVGDSTSNEYMPIDGAANDISGIRIDGFPGSLNSNTSSNDYIMHEKSFLWNYGNTGTVAIGTSNVTDESYWELQGGAFRLTTKKKVGEDYKNVSFSFRVNDREELELVKVYWSTTTNTYVYKRIAKFGRSFDSGSI
jgi:uncharacterized protein (DUF2345 family)